jgi:peroxiredoxin
MALTFTPEAKLGENCPEFELPSVDGQVYGLKSFADSKALVVMFLCNHCPYVKAVEDRVLALAAELKSKGAAFVAICSNDPKEYEEDSFENLKKRWKEKI